MSRGAYYNECEPYAAAWLRALVEAGEIAPGYVDSRDVRHVQPEDLDGFEQCHFFAGLGGWSRALRLAEWHGEREVWTGSAPCQPFSKTGYQGGIDDARHLWPTWARLIRERRPRVIFGEQVSSPDGLAWLDFVCADLEAEGYVCGPLDTCAASVGAPHIRQRIYFAAVLMDDAERERLEGLARNGDEFDERGRLDALAARSTAAPSIASATRGFWGAAHWLPCADGFARATEPGIFPLADGVSARMGKLRAYGNAIAPPLAAEFVRAFLDVERACACPF